MPYEHKAYRRVEFADTDMAGIVHFSNYFRFMETAESSFMRALGMSVDMKFFERKKIAIPRVHATCDYKKPLRFDDNVEIHLLVKEKRPRTITYEFRFRRPDAQGVQEEVARGKVVIVCVAFAPDGSISATPFPPEIADLIEVAPAELLAQ